MRTRKSDTKKFAAFFQDTHTATVIITITVPYRARGSLSSWRYKALIRPLVALSVYGMRVS